MARVYDSDDDNLNEPVAKKINLDNCYHGNIFCYETQNLDEFNQFTKSRIKISQLVPMLFNINNIIQIIKNTSFELVIKFVGFPEFVLDKHDYSPSDRFIINNIMNNQKDVYIYNGTFMSRILPKNKVSYLKSLWNRKNLSLYSKIYNIEYVRFKLVVEITNQVPDVDMTLLHVVIN